MTIYLNRAVRKTFIVAMMLAPSVQALAASDPYAPFVLPPDMSNTIILNGEITPRSGLAFRRAMAARPNANTLSLNSPGGVVQTSLLIAQDIFDRKMTTTIPEGASCVSACAFLFLAGTVREVKGRLGVHQMSSDKDSDLETQNYVSDIIETLSPFGTSSQVFSAMFRTPPDSMYYFTSLELTEYGIIRGVADESVSVSTASQTPLKTIERLPDPEPKPVTAAPGPSHSENEVPPSQYVSQAKEWAEKLITMQSDPYNAEFSKLTDIYSDNVVYYGKLTSKQKILDDKMSYFKRWPQRRYDVRQSTLETDCVRDICQVTGIYDWAVSSTERNKSATGIAKFTYKIEMTGGGFIIFEDGKVLK